MQVDSSERLKRSKEDFLTALTNPVLAATNSINASSQAKEFSQTLDDIGSLRDEYNDTIDEVKELSSKSYSLYKLNGDNSSYADAMKKTFEEGLVKVNGNWITMADWWTSGWDDAFDSVKSGAADILDELNPFKSLSTAEWTLTLLAYKRSFSDISHQKVYTILVNGSPTKVTFKEYLNHVIGMSSSYRNFDYRYVINRGKDNEEKFSTLEEYHDAIGAYGRSWYNGTLDDKIQFDLERLRNKSLISPKILEENRQNSHEQIKSIQKEDLTTKDDYQNDVGMFDKLTTVFGKREKFDDSTEDDLTDTKAVTVIQDIDGTEFDKIMVAGADFIPNHYTAAFYWENLATEVGKDKDWNLKNAGNNDENKFLTPAGLAVRMTKINVPQIKNDVFSVAGAFHDIKKLRSIKNIERKSSFTIRLDSRLAWLKALGQLAGENDFVESIGTVNDWRDSATFIANSLSYNSKTLDDKHLILAVMLNNLSPAWIPEGGIDNKLVWRVILFDNVKIVGTDNLTYSNEGGAKEMNIDFIYSGLRILKTDHYYNLRKISEL